MPAVGNVITGSGTVPTGGTTGQQLTKNSNANYDVGWAAAGSGGGGTPGGSTTQVQFNDAGAFGGDADFTWDKTGNMLTLTGQQTITFDNTDYTNTGGANSHLLLTNSNASGQNNFSSYINGALRAKMRSDSAGNINWVSYGTTGTAGHHFFTGGDYSVGNDRLAIFGASSKTVMAGNMVLGWASTSPLALSPSDIDTALSRNTAGAIEINSGVPGILGSLVSAANYLGTLGDTALMRNAAGVVEINNGTAGTYRDLKARTVNVTSGFQINGTSVAGDYINSNVSSGTPSTADVYLTGSNVVVPAGGFKAKGQYRCIFDVVKSAGTGTIVLSLRIGTTGTVASDTARITFTFPAGTSVADTGNMEVAVNWRTVGSGTTAVVSGFCRAFKNTVTAAGLWSDTSAAKTIVGTVSGGFDSSAATNMGLSFNGGTAFAGTITTVQATLNQ